jgi:hypothetical protein
MTVLLDRTPSPFECRPNEFTRGVSIDVGAEPGGRHVLDRTMLRPDARHDLDPR